MLLRFVYICYACHHQVLRQAVISFTSFPVFFALHYRCILHWSASYSTKCMDIYPSNFRFNFLIFNCILRHRFQEKVKEISKKIVVITQPSTYVLYYQKLQYYCNMYVVIFESSVK
jgi:hypothetical protein